jgi:hypothetical protein
LTEHFFYLPFLYIYYIDIIFLSYFLIYIYINISLSIFFSRENQNFEFFFPMNEENDENRKNPKIFFRNRTRDNGPDFRAQYQLNYEHMTKLQIRNVYKLNFGKVSTTNQTKPETSAKYCEARAELQVRGVRRAAGAQRERWACVRVGCRCADCLQWRADAASWLHSRGAQCAAIQDAMQCAALHGMHARDARQCAALHGMRCASRCAANWLRCNALRCTGCDARADALRTGCDAMRCARAGCIRAVQAAPCF